MKKPMPKEEPVAEALLTVTAALDKLDVKARLRIVRAVCAYYGIPVPKDKP